MLSGLIKGWYDSAGVKGEKYTPKAHTEMLERILLEAEQDQPRKPYTKFKSKQKGEAKDLALLYYMVLNWAQISAGTPTTQGRYVSSGGVFNRLLENDAKYRATYIGGGKEGEEQGPIYNLGGTGVRQAGTVLGDKIQDLLMTARMITEAEDVSAGNTRLKEALTPEKQAEIHGAVAGFAEQNMRPALARCCRANIPASSPARP